jgi:hypothetical protein
MYKAPTTPFTNPSGAQNGRSIGLADDYSQATIRLAGDPIKLCHPRPGLTELCKSEETFYLVRFNEK